MQKKKLLVKHTFESLNLLIISGGTSSSFNAVSTCIKKIQSGFFSFLLKNIKMIKSKITKHRNIDSRSKRKNAKL